MLASLAGVPAVSVRGLFAAANRFAVVTASREGPHASAIEGIQAWLASKSITSVVYRLPDDHAAMLQELGNGGSQIAIGVGVEGVRAVAANSRIPLVATMVFRTDLAKLRAAEKSEIKLAGAVWLDLPIGSIATGLRTVFPKAARFAVVRSASQTDAAEVGEAAMLPAGVSVKPVECAGASDLLLAIRRLRGEVEFVICLPDSNLYNKTTVEPLILASLEHKLPLVGYSASFVRAGAAVGVYPDFTELGRQTGALAERCLASPLTVHEDRPRKTTVAANERVLHLLGRDFRPHPGDEVVVVK